MAAYEQGLLLCWYFIIVSPELKPNKITDDEDKYNCPIELRLTEPLLIANKKDKNLFVRQHSSKPHVSSIP